MTLEIKDRFKRINCFLFDMDGTIYLGDRLLPGTLETLGKLTKNGIQYYFLTNNSSRSPIYYQSKLQKMGISVSQETILTSTHSLLAWLSDKQGQNVFVLGTAELKGILQDTGYTIIEKGGENADYVIVGFDTGVDYQTLTAACQYVDKGVPYIATHPDVRCPLDGGLYIPDCGSLLALIRAATGCEPLVVTGKPSHYMIDVALKRTGFAPEELAVVGDRLYTDIALGRDSGIFSILLLSGETTEADLRQSSVQPDIVLKGIGDIVPLL